MVYKLESISKNDLVKTENREIFPLVWSNVCTYCMQTKIFFKF
jgi:hypothetical protein